MIRESERNEWSEMYYTVCIWVCDGAEGGGGAGGGGGGGQKWLGKNEREEIFLGKRKRTRNRSRMGNEHFHASLSVQWCKITAISILHQ